MPSSFKKLGHYKELSKVIKLESGPTLLPKHEEYVHLPRYMVGHSHRFGVDSILEKDLHAYNSTN